MVEVEVETFSGAGVKIPGLLLFEDGRHSLEALFQSSMFIGKFTERPLGIGQVVDFVENEKVGYAWTLAQARADGNAEAIADLEDIAPYPGPEGIALEKTAIERKWSIHYGALAAGRSDAEYYFHAARLAPGFDLQDRKDMDAGSAFTMIGSTGPTAGQQYIVDTFLVVVFGGAGSLLGTIASAFSISQAQSIMEFFLSGSMAKVLTLLTVVGILMLRPQGLFALKLRK